MTTTSEPALSNTIPKLTAELVPSDGGEAFDIYRQNSASMCSVSLPEGVPPSSFWFRSVVFQLPYAVVFGASAPGHRMYRGPKELALGGDQIMIFAQIKGQVESVAAGRRHTIGPGDIAFYDYTQAYDSISSDFQMMALLIARDRVPPLFFAPSIHGTVLPAASSGARLLFRTLQGLLDTFEGMSLAEAAAAVDAVCIMAGGALQSTVSSNSVHGSGDVLVDKALAFIDRNISDKNLMPAHLEKHLKLSRSSLYRLFAPTGGVGAVILRRRLDASMKALLTGIASKLSLRLLTVQFGFSSETQFSRAFRNRFEITPRAFHDLVRRKDYDALSAQAKRAGFKTLQEWIEHLSGSSKKID